MRSSTRLAIEVRVVQKQLDETLLLVDSNERWSCQTQIRNDLRSGSLDTGVMDFHARLWGAANSSCEIMCRKHKN